MTELALINFQFSALEFMMRRSRAGIYALLYSRIEADW
jgi:hypothetical protein